MKGNKPYIIRLSIAFLCFWGWIFTSSAQKVETNDYFYVLNTRQGLSDNCILQMIQLADGRLVVRTPKGINLYDGRRFSFLTLTMRHPTERILSWESRILTHSRRVVRYSILISFYLRHPCKEYQAWLSASYKGCIRKCQSQEVDKSLHSQRLVGKGWYSPFTDLFLE